MELKPCPFCGSEIIVIPTKYMCDVCDCMYLPTSGTKEVRERWNTRPLEDALQAKLDIAVIALKNIVGYDEYNSSIEATDALKEINGEE